jgi:hypothetical protein
VVAKPVTKAKEADIRKVVSEMEDDEVIAMFGAVLDELAKDLGLEPDKDQLVTVQRIKMKLKSI